MKFVQKRNEIKTVCQAQTEHERNQREKRRSKSRQYSIDNALPYTSETVQKHILLVLAMRLRTVRFYRSWNLKKVA